MFPISDAFKKQLGHEGVRRTIEWFGFMTTENGVHHDINTKLIAPGTGVLESACELPFIGGAYSTSFQAQLLLRNVDPQTLKKARIELYVQLIHPMKITANTTWGELSAFTWKDLSWVSWDGAGQATTFIPMGVFYVTDAKRAMNSIKIESYDSMVKFDVTLPRMDTESRSVFGWLRWACDACGVELGITEEEIKAMPNGTRSFVYADIDTNVKTYRDMLGALSAVLGGVAMIDRAGRLRIARVAAEPVAEVTMDDRFSSEYEDTQSRYTGLRLQYKAKAVDEYYKNVSALEDTGHVVELGMNPFLQISNSSSRANTAQAIIDSLAPIAFTPFKASLPCHPEYDLLDVLAFSGGHAPDGCCGPITSITRTINGGTTIQCDVPPEQVNLNRRTVQTTGSGSSGYTSRDFWLQLASFPETETQITDYMPVTKLKANCTADNTDMQIAWTGFYILDQAATVTVRVFVDKKEIYTASDDQTAGNHILNVTTGHSVDSKGEYEVEIFVAEVPL